LFFALSAIVLLFGAYKVFERIMFGEDVVKSIAVWVLAAIFIFLIGVAVDQLGSQTYRSADSVQKVFSNEAIK